MLMHQGAAPVLDEPPDSLTLEQFAQLRRAARKRVPEPPPSSGEAAMFSHFYLGADATRAPVPRRRRQKTGNAPSNGPITCTKCGSRYKTRKSLRAHIRIQCGKEPNFHCPLCEKKTYQKIHIEVHMSHVHNATWGDMFSGHSIMAPDSDDMVENVEMKWSDGATQLKWSEDSSAPSTGARKFRVIQRSGDGDYKCSKCKKQYKTRKTLQVHMRFQCGKEPQFQCPLCPKQAYQKVHIEMHVWGTHKMIGWKYWNKNKPKDENNRPHAMPVDSAAELAIQIKKEPEDNPNDTGEERLRDHVEKRRKDMMERTLNDHVEKKPNDEVEEKPNDHMEEVPNTMVENRSNVILKVEPNASLESNTATIPVQEELGFQVKREKIEDPLGYFQQQPVFGLEVGNEIRYPCLRCGRSYRHKTHFYRHRKHECYNNDSHSCSLCHKVYKRKESLKTHMTVCHGSLRLVEWME
ncbi:hypothetical protein WDU94_005804 [Cyamophila willieti]